MLPCGYAPGVKTVGGGVTVGGLGGCTFPGTFGTLGGVGALGRVGDGALGVCAAPGICAKARKVLPMTKRPPAAAAEFLRILRRENFSIPLFSPQTFCWATFTRCF